MILSQERIVGWSEEGLATSCSYASHKDKHDYSCSKSCEHCRHAPEEDTERQNPLTAVAVTDNTTEWYENGRNQSGQKKSAAADAHISLTKNLNAIMKQLLDLVPPAQKESRLTALMDK